MFTVHATYLNLFSSLNAQNAGAGEWNTHCIDCVPLAKQAKKARLERPTSAKIRMILKLLNDIDVRSDGEEKTIIFSQFTSMLNLIEPFLKEKGIKYVRCGCFFLCSFACRQIDFKL